MISPINIHKAVVCECYECSELVEITPFSNSTDEYEADYSCFECGKVVCESCHGDMIEICYGDPEDEDIQRVCQSCVDKKAFKCQPFT